MYALQTSDSSQRTPNGYSMRVGGMFCSAWRHVESRRNSWPPEKNLSFRS